MARFFFSLILSTVLLVGNVSAGGPLIDTASIFGAKKLSSQTAKEFRKEMEVLLDYFFDLKLEPFLDTLNDDVKAGAKLVDGMAEARLNQVNSMLLEVVQYANETTFANADEFQQRVTNNAYTKFSALKKEMFAELNALNENVFTSLGCTGVNFKEGLPLIGESKLEEMYQSHPFVFEESFGFGTNFKDSHGCFKKYNVDKEKKLSDYQKMIIFVCAVEREFDLGQMKASNIVEEYGELSRVATLTYCKYSGEARSITTQELIFDAQTELLRKASAWKKLVH